MDLVGTLGEGLDLAFVRAAFRSPAAGRRARAQGALERIDEAAQVYSEAVQSGRLYARPEPVRGVETTSVRPLPRGAVVDLHWPSTYCGAGASYERWMSLCPKTRTAHARWLRHESPRNALICLHGYAAGAFPFEEQAYRANWLYGLGIDVVFATLPFHARRAQHAFGRPIFPNPDPFCSNDGFAQAIYDVRALMGLLRERGVERIAISGMSLGGFTSSLLATVEPEIDAVIPIIPFASLPRLMWEHGEGTEARRLAEQDGLTLERFEAAYAATTPLRRQPLIPGERILLIGGEHDRVTPLSHARALREHFSDERARPHLETFSGSHLVQSGRRAAFSALARFLAAQELIEPRPKRVPAQFRRVLRLARAVGPLTRRRLAVVSTHAACTSCPTG